LIRINPNRKLMKDLRKGRKLKTLIVIGLANEVIEWERREKWKVWQRRYEYGCM